MDYGALPPEINSARAYAGPQSAPLTAAAGAWQGLAAGLGSIAAALQGAIAALVAGGWQGPSSALMATGGAQNVRWLYQAAVQAQETAIAAAHGAAAVEAAHAGVIPPPLIEANRNLLQALIASNFLGVNSAAIAACVAEYDQMWAQDASVMYGFSADAAAVTGALVPFTPLEPTVNPGGLAGQAAAVAQAGSTSAGQAGAQAAAAGQSVVGGGSSSALDAASIVAMAPQFLGAVPQVLQGMSQPLTSGMSSPLQSLGGFQSLLSPFLAMMNNPGLAGAGTAAAGAAPPSAIAGLGGLGGAAGGFGAAGAGAVSAGLGRAGSLGGLSVPATWAASAQSHSETAAPGAAGGVRASVGAAPASAPGGMGAAPMAALAGRDSSAGNGPSYGAPVRVLPGPR
jgi:PPE-repeat protein